MFGIFGRRTLQVAGEEELGASIPAVFEGASWITSSTCNAVRIRRDIKNGCPAHNKARNKDVIKYIRI